MKKIEFYPVTELAYNNVEPPKPASLFIPQWFKDAPRFDDNKFKINIDNQANATIKMCQPFMDTFVTGYIQETWCDINISIDDKNKIVDISYDSEFNILSNRTKSYFSAWSDFYPIEFAWNQPWIPSLPKGYSMLYTHPLNRNDLDFYSLSGIVDSDTYSFESKANYPMILRRSSSGFIPKGTPMFQMIPIKRDAWKSNSNKFTRSNFLKSTIVRKYFMGGYKKLYWQKKKYQ